MSARGVTRYDLHAARPYDEIVTAAAEDALNGPTSPAGIVRLTDVHAALAVQQALLAGWVDDPDPAEDALDLFLARTLDQPSGDPFLISFACAEFGRTGADEPLDATARWLRDQQAPIPGLGMAVSQASLLRVLRGFEVQPLIDWLIGLGPADLAGPIGAAARLERLAIAALRDEPGQSDERLAAAVAVGGWLGAGLKGRAVRPLSPVDTAYLAAVLGLADEELTIGLRRRWGGAARELVQRAEAEVLFEITGRPAGPGPLVAHPGGAYLRRLGRIWKSNPCEHHGHRRRRRTPGAESHRARIASAAPGAALPETAVPGLPAVLRRRPRC